MTSAVEKKYPGSWGESAHCGQFSAIITGIKSIYWDFPSGPVVKNSPANAGDTGSIPGQGIKILYVAWHGQIKKNKKESSCQRKEQRFSPWSEKIPHAAGQPSWSATTTKSAL